MNTRSIPGHEDWVYFTNADTCLLKAVLRTLEPSYETGRAETFIRPSNLYKSVRSRLQIPLCQGPQGSCEQGWRERNAEFIRGEEPLGLMEADIVAESLGVKITFWDEDGEVLQCTCPRTPKRAIYLRVSRTKQFNRVAFEGTGVYELVFEP